MKIFDINKYRRKAFTPADPGSSSEQENNQSLATKENISFNVSKFERFLRKQFPSKFESSQEEKMYNRAIGQLSMENRRRSIVNEDIQSRNGMKLIHFHIDAFDDEISLNKMAIRDGGVTSQFTTMNPVTPSQLLKKN